MLKNIGIKPSSGIQIGFKTNEAEERTFGDNTIKILESHLKSISDIQLSAYGDLGIAYTINERVEVVFS